MVKCPEALMTTSSAAAGRILPTQLPASFQSLLPAAPFQVTVDGKTRSSSRVRTGRKNCRHVHRGRRAGAIGTLARMSAIYCGPGVGILAWSFASDKRFVWEIVRPLEF